MDENVNNSIKTLGKLTNELAEKQYAWFRHILLVSATLFGILISLHGKNSDMLHIRLCFALAIVVLALGILQISIAMYSHIDALRRSRKVYTKETIDALHEHRASQPVSVPVRKIFVFCEKSGYICFALSVVLLAVYALLLALS